MKSALDTQKVEERELPVRKEGIGDGRRKEVLAKLTKTHFARKRLSRSRSPVQFRSKEDRNVRELVKSFESSLPRW